MGSRCMGFSDYRLGSRHSACNLLAEISPNVKLYLRPRNRVGVTAQKAVRAVRSVVKHTGIGISGTLAGR